MFDFPPGTPGLIVTAPSGASYQYDGAKWVGYNAGGAASGDITGVAAGHGLTGGGTSGDVTVALATPVAVADGGTGATTAPAALAALGGLSDAPSDATLYARKSAAWAHAAFSDITGVSTYAQLPAEVAQVPIAFPWGGKPAASAVINIPMAMSLVVPASLAGTRVFASTGPAGTPTFTLNRIVGTTPTAIGTIQFTGQTTATLSGAGATLNAGDTLQLVAPSSQDSALADCSVTILAART